MTKKKKKGKRSTTKRQNVRRPHPATASPRSRRRNTLRRLFVLAAGIAGFVAFLAALVAIWGWIGDRNRDRAARGANLQQLLYKIHDHLAVGEVGLEIIRPTDDRTSLELARRDIEKAFRLKIPSSALHRYQAIYLSGVSRSRAAEAEARKALEVDPEDPEAHLLLSHFLVERGAFSEAVISSWQGIQFNCCLYALWNNLGIALHKLHAHQPSAAVTPAEKQIDSQLASDSSHTLVFSQGRLRRAEWALRQAASYAPKSSDLIVKNLVSFYKSLGSLQMAIEVARLKVAAEHADYSDYCELVALLDAANQPQTATLLAEEAVRKFNTEALAFFNLAVRRHNSGLTDQAATLYERAVELDEHYTPAILKLSRLRLQEDRLEEASELLASALTNSPGMPAVARQQGMLALLKGDSSRANEWLERCAAIDPSGRVAKDGKGPFAIDGAAWTIPSCRNLVEEGGKFSNYWAEVLASNRCPRSKSTTYGFFATEPVHVGGGMVFGPARARGYLAYLRGPDGEDVSHQREGSMPSHGHTVDRYHLKIEGQDSHLTIFICQYAFDRPQVPEGLGCRRTLPIRWERR